MLIRSAKAALPRAEFSFGEEGLLPEEWPAGAPDPANGLFVASHLPQSIFDLIHGEHVVGAEVAVRAVAADWLQTGGVRRWYHFAKAAELGPLDRPHTLTAKEHMAPGPRLWAAASTEAVPLLAEGFIHALVSAGPMHAHHFVLREAQDKRNVPAIGFLHAIADDDVGTLGFLWGDTFPFDVIISPTECGARGFQMMQERFRERLQVDVPIYRGEVAVIPYGVDAFTPVPDARGWLDWDKDDLVFLAIARLDRMRKYDAAPLLIAFREFLREQPNALLVLAGAETEPHYAEKLQDVAEELGISKRVQIRPDFANDDKTLFLSAADVFVAFTDNIQETYGVAVVEAMMAGLPVIASDFDGFKESVRPETGILLPTYMHDPEPEVMTLMGVRRSIYQFTLQSDATSIDIPAALQAFRAMQNRDVRVAMGEAGARRAVNEYSRAKNHARMLQRVHEAVRKAAAMPVQKPKRQMVDWRKTFADFPSGWFANDTLIERGPVSTLPLTGALGEMLGTKHRQQLQKLLALALAAAPLPLGELAGRLAHEVPSFHRDAAARHIVQFVKYGLLRAKT